MREILFKAKRIDNGKWIEGYYFYNPNIDKHFVHNWLSGGLVKVDKDTICQYTGLTDKNGNMIWENDIVKAEVKQNSLCQSSLYSDFYQISYHEKYCYFYLKKKNNNLLFDGNWSYYLKSIEVIGNTFDNADLLKGE